MSDKDEALVKRSASAPVPVKGPESEAHPQETPLPGPFDEGEERARAILDDPEALAQMDAARVLPALGRMPDHFTKAMLTHIDLPNGYSQVDNVVVTGMGSSGIGGDLLRVLLAPRVELPIIVNKGYDVPAFVSNRTLLVAVSHSGNTEETVGSCSAGLAHGAKVAVITTGGTLSDMSKQAGLPLIELPGSTSARGALPYMFYGLIGVLRAAGLIEWIDGEAEMINVLGEKRDAYAPSTPLAANRAKRIAAALHGRLPIIYGADELSGVAAMRWKSQINENAKMIAHFNYFPELHHNEVVGFSYPEELLARTRVVLLRDRQDHPQVVRRMDVTKEMLSSRLGPTIEAWAQGYSELARVFSLIYLGDHVSAYLAALNGVDPSDSSVIDLIKNLLGEEA